MKAAIIGIMLMGIAWLVAQWGKYNNDLAMTVVCSAPIAIFGIIVYFYRGKPDQAKIDFRIPKADRVQGEEHLPQWVVNTRREMERNADQRSNWRDRR